MACLGWALTAPGATLVISASEVIGPEDQGDCIPFDAFVHQLAEGKYAFATDILKLALTNTQPTAATDTVFLPGSLHPPPAAANGYTAGGYAVTISSHEDVGGTFELRTATDIVITATAGGIGPFRYLILYDDTALNNELIGYYDYGSSITLTAGSTLTLKMV